MTHVPEIGAGFLEPIFGAGSWTVCHRHNVIHKNMHFGDMPIFGNCANLPLLCSCMPNWAVDTRIRDAHFLLARVPCDDQQGIEANLYFACHVAMDCVVYDDGNKTLSEGNFIL